MKVKTQIIFIITSILITLSALTLVFALLLHKIEKEEIIYELGNIKLVVTGSLKENYLYPGGNMVETDYLITNQSTIDLDLRIKLIFYLDEVEIDITSLIEEDGFDFDETSFLLNADGYYYYHETLTPDDEEITLFTNLTFDGYIVKNEYNDQVLKIKLVVQAKQNRHVDWTDLGDKFIN
ncbi:MAG: hypothetical protein GX794_04370 [Acholeplasmataceae bacterium]|jgi:hypothetical protein|nr:hypothetical protein [Acholeplasmataceae bacterium]